ncbi:MAG: ribonuclease domain-containing protein, partial [Leadbetterella sp.]
FFVSESKKEVRTEQKDSYKEVDSKIQDSYKEEELGNHDIPQKVLEVLDFVLKNRKAPEGYVGGRRFQNREQLLPKVSSSGTKIVYQEWDVNPKMAGQNRGRERLVTGDDGSAYYTDDHYSSFKKIQ